MGTDYKALAEQYPEFISKDQLCRICHIGKRKAKWLLENGYIPCIDTGKKTHRFEIRIEDAINYLRAMERSNQLPTLPKGSFSSRTKPQPILSEECVCDQCEQIPVSEIAIDEKDNIYKSFLEETWSDCPDALTPDDVCRITGYTRRTVGKWLTRKKLKSVRTPNGILIAKEWLIEFFQTYPSNVPVCLSKEHRKLKKDYQLYIHNK